MWGGGLSCCWPRQLIQGKSLLMLRLLPPAAPHLLPPLYAGCRSTRPSCCCRPSSRSRATIRCVQGGVSPHTPAPSHTLTTLSNPFFSTTPSAPRHCCSTPRRDEVCLENQELFSVSRLPVTPHFPHHRSTPFPHTPPGQDPPREPGVTAPRLCGVRTGQGRAVHQGVGNAGGEGEEV